MSARRATLTVADLPTEAVPVDAPYAPDWIVSLVVDHGHREYYRYEVHGVNTNAAPGDYGHRFEWRVHDLWWRYDFGAARVLTFAGEATRERATRHRARSQVAK